MWACLKELFNIQGNMETKYNNFTIRQMIYTKKKCINIYLIAIKYHIKFNNSIFEYIF